MSAIARMVMLDLRTVAPYRYQGLVVFGACVIRFGYSRISVLCTILPLALIMVAVTRLHLTVVSFASIQPWLPLLWVAGIAATVASVALATTADRRRLRK